MLVQPFAAHTWRCKSFLCRPSEILQADVLPPALRRVFKNYQMVTPSAADLGKCEKKNTVQAYTCENASALDLEGTSAVISHCEDTIIFNLKDPHRYCLA